MEILNNYLEYRKSKPKYAEWHTKREENLAKKEQYLKEHPLNREQKDKLVQKASVVLNAVDTMDEFSQNKAENTEIATDALSGFAISLAMLAGMGAGTLFMKTKGGQALIEKLVKKHPGLENFASLIPTIIGSVVSLPFVAPIVTWATKSQIFASKVGRHEAVKGDLALENQFPILDKKQEE